MLTLGIESTAHTLGISVLQDSKILVDERAIYSPREGGIHPVDAAEHHASHAKLLLQKANQKIDLEKIDVVSYARGPGLPPCLEVGAVLARTLALRLKKPLIGVNHCIAHIEWAKALTGSKDPVVLYVSGGNSQIVAYSKKRYRVFGETLDIAIGNALDKFARTLNLQHPGGPKVEKLALKGKTLLELPYVVKGMDFSFAGLVTKLENLYHQGYKPEDLCYSFQEYAFAMLTEATERAVAHLQNKKSNAEVVLTGGVAANSRLREMLAKMCEERNARFYHCPKNQAGDNGCMIAYQGYLEFKSGRKTDISEKVRINWRPEEVDVIWIT